MNIITGMIPSPEVERVEIEPKEETDVKEAKATEEKPKAKEESSQGESPKKEAHEGVGKTDKKEKEGDKPAKKEGGT